MAVVENLNDNIQLKVHSYGVILWEYEVENGGFCNLAAKSIMVKTETNQWALKESVTFADWE